MKKSPFGMTLWAAFIDKFLHEVYTVMNQERTAVGYSPKRKRGDTMPITFTFTFHVFDYTFTFSVKVKNRHSAK